MKKIGILGGMGPQASISFYNLIIEIAQKKFGAQKNSDFPNIIIHNLPVKDLISNDGDKNETINFAKKSYEDLKKIKANIFAMPCNTMHLYENQIFQNDKGFLSMIDCVIEKIKKEKKLKIGILGSKNTIENNLYQNKLNNLKIENVVLNKNEQDKTVEIIKKYIAGEDKYKLKKLLERQIDLFVKNGCDGIILGCTELPLIINESKRITIYPSLNILAEKVCKEFFQKN